MTQPLGKALIFLGLGIAAFGVILMVFGRIPFLGKLPGDIYIKKEQMTFFFPITSCLLISVIVTVILRLWKNK